MSTRSRKFMALIVAFVSLGECYADSSAQWDKAVSGVLDLQTAQQIALAGNPSLQAAQARIEQAQARLGQARSLYFPSLDSSITASATELSNRTMALLPPGADDTAELYEANLTATWLVFDGFGRKFRTAAARSGKAQTEQVMRETQRLLLGGVATAYYNVQLARESIAIAKADEAFNQRLLREAQARKRVGTGSLSDELNFQVRVRTAKTSLIQAEGRRRVALIALAELMGIPDANLPLDLQVAPLPAEGPEELELPDLDSALKFGLEHRPDLLQRRYRVKQTEAGVGLERSDYIPTVSALGSLDGQRPEDGHFEEDDFSATIGVGLNYNIFSGGRRKAELHEAKALKTEAERLRRQAELAVASEIRRAHQNLITAQEALALQRETTQYVERNRELVEKEYTAGQGSLVRLNEAQRDLIAQRSRLAVSRVGLKQSVHDLRTATGQTLGEAGTD